MLEPRIIAAPINDRHIDDKVAERDACAASVVSCMGSYTSTSSHAKAKTEDALRKNLPNA